MGSDARPDEVLADRIAIAYDNTTDVVFLLRVEATGAFRFESVNRAFQTATGLARDFVVGKRVEEVLPPSSHGLVLARYREAIATRAAVNWEEVASYPAGTRVGLVRIVPVVDDSGVVTYLVGTVHDVTALRETEELLYQARKMEAIGLLAGGVAHDFNNLLTVILSYSAILADGLGSGDSMLAGLGEIRTAAERAAALTHQLLAFSRQQILRPKVIDLNDLVSGMDALLRRIIGEDIDFVVRLEPDVLRVLADPGQLEQAVMNLAINARDAMPRGGKLTIETGRIDLDDDYARQHPGVVPGPHVMLVVTDMGTGMDRATQARVFEPFFTTKEKSKGTGLGLSTVLGIVKQSGGHLWLYSEVGKGTTFKLYFPRTSMAPEVARTSRPETSAARGSEMILLVEDEPQVRIVLRGILKRHGYQVLEAQNGAEALLLCERFSGEIQLLITDVVMPQMSGHEIAERLTEMRPRMKVLYVSGYTDDTIVRHGVLDVGVNFLEKPITPDALARKVREVLDDA